MKKRFETIDSFRGLLIVNMVLFHLLYDINVIFDRDPSWVSAHITELWQRFIACSFVIVSGFVWTYGRRRAVRRGLFLTLVGIAVTTVTMIVTPSSAIYFGVMSFFGCAVLLMIPVERIMRHIHPIVGMAVSLGAFILLEDLSYGIIKFGEHIIARLPESLYSSDLLIPLGFPPSDFFSADYFPILPWMFLYLFGYFLNRQMADTAAIEKIGHFKVPILSQIGRHSVLIYILHQPICYGICMLML